jgi:creatinine amidohydrolase/Fe(II)-dependent formamide hydrolase-like protein
MTVDIGDMRLPQVEEHVRNEARIFIPLGSTEQHGAHAPYCTDTLLATEVCRRLARRLGGVVAPGLPYGLSGDHRGFAGVPYLSVRSFTGVMQDLVRSFTAGGFKQIIFVNGHYTNVIAMAAAIAEVGDELPDDSVVFAFNYWDPLPPEQLAAYLSDEVGLHANIGETSAVLAVNEALVDMELAAESVPDFPTVPSPAVVSAFFFSGTGTTHRAMHSGVWGDPRESTVELGKVFLEQIEEAGVHFVSDVIKTFAAFPRRQESWKRAQNE